MELHELPPAPDQCRCLNPPLDDGQTTCWLHHDCSDGSCTHQDVDDEPRGVWEDQEDW